MLRLQILSMLTVLIAAAIGVEAVAGTVQIAPVQLLMVRQDGCHFCAEWEREIGTDYNETAQGIAAPLLRVNVHGPWPDGLALDRRPVVTPTFILIQDGIETGRIEGYPGPQEFRGELGELLSSRGIAVSR
ncbi:SoxS protein [Paracoccus aerodenitrificans]|uniref:SoxS protein n=1 Tax=Paracoccus aerodenitrificans TaxID=3017781 RepID=UPI0022F0C2A2|nr:SoxS protein [Paracoccus aerodenitrificans]WBU63247.1 SoxS protein [Paracoccus aerodenitrificans]